MFKHSPWVIAGLVCASLACTKEDPELARRLDKIDNRLASIEAKIANIKGGAAGAPAQPRGPDPNTVYSVPVGADDAAWGPASAKVTIVEAADFA